MIKRQGSNEKSKLRGEGTYSEDIKAQAEELINTIGESNVLQFVLMPNAAKGTPLAPLSGYVLDLKDTAPFLCAYLDPETAFKGRSAVKLSLGNLPAGANIGERMAARVTPAWINSTASLSIQEAFLKLEELSQSALNKDGHSYMKLRASRAVQSSVLIAECGHDNDEFYIIFDAHALLEDEQPFQELLRNAENGKASVKSVISSSLYKWYYASVKKFRHIVCTIMHRHLYKLLVDDNIYDAGDARMADPVEACHHYETNQITFDKNDSVRVLNEAFDAELGALIYAGPFREMIWVNKTSTPEMTKVLVAAGLAEGVPYNMPTSVSRSSALEKIIMSRLMKVDAARETSNEFARLEVIKRESARAIMTITSKSVSVVGSDTAYVSKRIAQRYTSGELKSTLVWNEAVANIPVVVPEELLAYHLGIENKAVWDLLKKHGVDAGNAKYNSTLRIIIQTLGVVPIIDQLAIWRASHSVVQLIVDAADGK